MAIITIDDGTREFTIENKYGKEICKIHFRPADFSIAERYSAMREDFAQIVRPLEHITLKADGTAETEEGLRVLHEVDLAFRTALNKLLDFDDADGIFRTRNPFSAVGGRFFAENILDALGEIISSTVEEESRASAARMAQYLDGDSDARAASAET